MSTDFFDIKESLKRIEDAAQDREDKLEGKIDKLTDSITSALLRLEAIEARTAERPCEIHEAFINGNGKPGAKERLANVEKAQALTTKILLGAMIWIAAQVGWTVWSKVINPVAVPGTKEAIHQTYEPTTPK
jgi:predicted alternative tryptophan synthase beta-subunit